MARLARISSSSDTIGLPSCAPFVNATACFLRSLRPLTPSQVRQRQQRLPNVRRPVILSLRQFRLRTKPHLPFSTNSSVTPTLPSNPQPSVFNFQPPSPPPLTASLRFLTAHLTGCRSKN